MRAQGGNLSLVGATASPSGMSASPNSSTADQARAWCPWARQHEQAPGAMRALPANGDVVAVLARLHFTLAGLPLWDHVQDRVCRTSDLTGGHDDSQQR